MTTRRPNAGFVSRPRDVQAWIAAPEVEAQRAQPGTSNTARLTVDVTPQLRHRIKLAALGRGVTVSDMLREMLHQAFPEDGARAP